MVNLDRKSTRLNSSHTVIYTLSLHDALPICNKNRIINNNTQRNREKTLLLLRRLYLFAGSTGCHPATVSSPRSQIASAPQSERTIRDSPCPSCPSWLI